MDRVVTAQEMARVERLAREAGCSEESFMRGAGWKVAEAVFALLEKRKLPKRVALLAGKGNNGGDGYAAALFLLEKGVQVDVFTPFPLSEAAPLNQKFGILLTQRNGPPFVVSDASQIDFHKDSLILDALLGTGFQGKTQGLLAQVIERANHARKPIIAIDIPSGLDGTTGEVLGACVRAEQTVALGMAKSGFFLREGWNRIGELRVESFGLPEQFLALAKPFALLPTLPDLVSWLPPIVRNRHKYQAGYVVGVGGAPPFQGASKMAGLAALRSGAGIVRIFQLGEIGEAPLELICEKWEEESWKREAKRAKALFLGPGFGINVSLLHFFLAQLQELKKPCVIDADALQNTLCYPPQALLTPHRKEVLRLLGLEAFPEEEELFAQCQRFCEGQNLILILKGAPTFIFAKGEVPTVIARGDPGMAKAGSGDVLTGVIAALLAQGVQPLQAARLGVALHAIAGEIAAKEKTSYGEIASDLIDALPKAFQTIMGTL